MKKFKVKFDISYNTVAEATIMAEDKNSAEKIAINFAESNGNGIDGVVQDYDEDPVDDWDMRSISINSISED